MAKKPDKKAEAKPQAEAADAPAKPAGGMMGLLMLGAASLVSSFGLVYFLTPPPSAATAACEPGDLGADAEVKPALKADQAYVQLQEMVITVGSAPATRYLKMNISVMTDSVNTAAVQAAEPVLLDAFNTYLRSIEMKDFEDPGFYPRMREQLARRSELVLGSGVSNGVLITEFLLR
ncbi:flagellar basal body-associated FliL family protein [Hyphomonas sp.]|uniref:flagellar basal body-associated FliL family protein n=1 Tax=Hyphomonas sp. TaxID=87 RepID=UPI0025C1CB29|nr:flagellar basal body-associated FliL family protein [Hyphomonas sp.]